MTGSFSFSDLEKAMALGHPRSLFPFIFKRLTDMTIFRYSLLFTRRAVWTLLAARMKASREHRVPHGFRSSFRDWAAECTDAPHEVCELALAHVNGNRVEAAYSRMAQAVSGLPRSPPELADRSG